MIAFRGPPPAVKPVHMAKMVNDKGDVSPLCAARPRRINLKVATWTNRAEAVTCKKCLTALASPKATTPEAANG